MSSFSSFPKAYQQSKVPSFVFFCTNRFEMIWLCLLITLTEIQNCWNETPLECCFGYGQNNSQTFFRVWWQPHISAWIFIEFFLMGATITIRSNQCSCCDMKRDFVSFGQTKFSNIMTFWILWRDSHWHSCKRAWMFRMSCGLVSFVHIIYLTDLFIYLYIIII